MRYVTSGLQIAGLATLAIGCGLLSLPLGIIVAGVGLFAIGFVLDQRPAR
jgi:hypothetical protein